MKMRLIYAISLFLSLLTASLATGSVLLLMFSAVTALTVIISIISVIWAAGTLRVSAQFTEQSVYRGDDTALMIQIRHSGRIPIAPIMLDIPSMSGSSDREIRLRDLPGHIQSLRMPIHASHVGIYPCGIRSCTVEDLLGLIKRVVHPAETAFQLTVLPRTFNTDPLKMAPGDPDSEIMARATEDLNAPSDIRAYQPGDAMKKIHWKLSVRKGELIVRKFDEPVMQDVLILMDCSKPPSWGHPEAEADIRDALLETAASLYSDQLKTDHPVRLPITGNHPVEADRNSGPAAAFEYLAKTDFSAPERFERILQMESRHMRKVGCAAVISARLNYAMVDTMIRIHRMGPNVRLYLITFAPDDQNVIPLISRLRQAGIEVAYVTPGVSE